MSAPAEQNTEHATAHAFIEKWRGVNASELSTSQSFLIDLCQLLGVDTPHPTPAQDYMFERPITFVHGDGSRSAGRIDLYRRGAFVLESKKLKAGAHTKGFDEAMLRARSQAENYARALPAEEGRPPFVLVVDVGQRIELYSEFSRSGGTYTPFPDPRHYRIALDDLADPAVRARLRAIWLDPLSLDPSRESARVTREIAARLAELAKSLEHSGHNPEAVAQFLMRCLFTMFAEDVRLLPPDALRNLLATHREKPDIAMRMLAQLWRDMDSGGFSAVLADDVLRFNGKLFKQPDTLPLNTAQIDLLTEAAKADWQHVEPAIFGTLLERALNPKERHKLGAHYTPRAYVERLVLPTVIEPLRQEWGQAHVAALALASEGDEKQAIGQLLRFHQRLCNVRVLDPACGSGNFLYVTLEHLKRLEGEVLNALDEMGYRQTGLALAGERADAAAGETVDPHNLLGIELNPRAAAIAEVVLWIGYLQWHFRTRGDVNPPVPVIRDFRNIENRDAVLACERVDYVLDETGKPVTRWDGQTWKTSPVTGEQIPDETARVPLEHYINPSKAEWPEADFVVGNPPFIGNKRMRLALGDGYVDALRKAWPEMPESADLVMYWWHYAAQLTVQGQLQGFGLITTNSIRQTFNRRVIEAAMQPRTSSSPLPPGEGLGVREPGERVKKKMDIKPLTITFAIPDHPWVDGADGAAVRIAMTVGTCNAAGEGKLLRVMSETASGEGEVHVQLEKQRGLIQQDLRVGANVAAAKMLRANSMVSNRGVIPHGEGMTVTEEQAATLGLGQIPGIESRLRPYRNGRDLTQVPRGVRVIDMYGLTAEQVRAQYPSIYQWLLERVKPERDVHKDRDLREKWWLHRRNNEDLRKSLDALERYIATVQTAKHRFFTFLDAEILPDDKLIAIALDDAASLGVLSSQVHVVWALAAGARLGVGNDPVYNKSTCFDCFPFPDTTQSETIRQLAEQLDAHRKQQQALHPGLTLTGIYNVLEKLRSGEPLTAKERTVHEQGVVSVLRQLHDELDAAVLEAYGWSDLLPLLRIAHGNDTAENQSREDAKRAFDEAVLERLVALNTQRAAEEAQGQIRWLRPELQNPVGWACLPTTTENPAVGKHAHPTQDGGQTSREPTARTWPKDPVEQVQALLAVLGESHTPQTCEQITHHFKGRGTWRKQLPGLLTMLTALGHITEENGHYRT